MKWMFNKGYSSLTKQEIRYIKSILLSLGRIHKWNAFEDKGEEHMKSVDCLGLACLNHFDLLKKKNVGETINTLDIITAKQGADKVINI